MAELLAKISSYNIFNYFFPGIIFWQAVEALGIWSIGTMPIIGMLFFYYFVGLTISRVGSLVIEPVMRRCGLLAENDYSHFVKASRKDPKLEVLLEVGNTYRTLASAFILLPILLGLHHLAARLGLPKELLTSAATIALAAIFIVSFLKQSEFIRKRIGTNKGK